mmetsp:Transcript_25267/g.25501  ORF Transcript_25267/g.25501 Transcript_25267/m.25501 type:complete len:172 (-) Transcript_25267:56-571(-)
MFVIVEKKITRNSTHPMCACAQSERAIVSNKPSCLIARYRLCQDKLMRQHFLNLCSACAYLDTLYTNISSTINVNNTIINNLNITEFNSTVINTGVTAICQAEIVRSVGFLVGRGMCSSKPLADCSSETTTKDGGETINFLTLRPYLYPGSFTPLGNSYGGFGWFDSPMLG